MVFCFWFDVFLFFFFEPSAPNETLEDLWDLLVSGTLPTAAPSFMPLLFRYDFFATHTTMDGRPTVLLSAVCWLCPTVCCLCGRQESIDGETKIFRYFSLVPAANRKPSWMTSGFLFLSPSLSVLFYLTVLFPFCSLIFLTPFFNACCVGSVPN